VASPPFPSGPRIDAAPGASEHHPRYPGWRVALASAVGIFCWSIPPYSFAVFLRPMAEEFGWSRQAMAMAFGVAPLVGAVGSPVAGYLVDRLGARRIVLPSLVVAGLALAARAYVEPPFWHLAALFAVTGLGAGGASPIAYARLVSSWFDERRGLALGVAIAGSALGAMLHPPLAQVLIDRVGWRNAYLILGAVILGVGVPVVARFVRPTIRSAPGVGSSVPRVDTGATLRHGLTSRLFWVLFAVLLVDSLANSSITIHLPAMLTDRGIPAAHGAMALSAMGAAAIAGRLATGWLLDRVFAIYVSVSLLLASAVGVFVLTSADSVAAGAFGAALVGFGMGGEGDVTPYLLSRYFGLRSFSTLYGGMFTATAVAWAIGPTLMGRTHDATGSYASQLVTLTIALLGAAALMLTLPRYARQSPSAIAQATG
jgi:MFS family permease